MLKSSFLPSDYSFSVHPPSVVASSTICSAVTGSLGQSKGQLIHKFHALTAIDPVSAFTKGSVMMC